MITEAILRFLQELRCVISQKTAFLRSFEVQSTYFNLLRSMMPVVLYRCETLSLTVREEHKLRVFENMALRIFGPKRDGVTEGWRKLHNEELHNLYSSPIIIRRMVSSGILRRVALVRTDVSEELSASFITVTRISELGTTLALTSNRRTLRRNTKRLFLQEPHGATSQKTPFFIVTAVKFSNLLLLNAEING
jgi:hypothetical protein